MKFLTIIILTLFLTGCEETTTTIVPPWFAPVEDHTLECKYYGECMIGDQGSRGKL